jgi:hypothetical protein
MKSPFSCGSLPSIAAKKKPAGLLNAKRSTARAGRRCVRGIAATSAADAGAGREHEADLRRQPQSQIAGAPAGRQRRPIAQCMLHQDFGRVAGARRSAPGVQEPPAVVNRSSCQAPLTAIRSAKAAWPGRARRSRTPARITRSRSWSVVVIGRLPARTI